MIKKIIFSVLALTFYVNAGCDCCDQKNIAFITKNNQLEVVDAYFSVLKGAPNGAAYFKIKPTSSDSKVEDDELLKAEYIGNDIQTVELHTHIIENNVAKMRQVDSFIVDAKEGKVFEPGADHVMLMRVDPSFDKEEISLVLTFKNAGKLKVVFKRKNIKKSCCGHHE